MEIPSYPPRSCRPTADEAAHHINEEARLVLTSLRGGPPYLARGGLAVGLRDLRSYVRGRSMDSGMQGPSRSDAYDSGSLSSLIEREECKVASTPDEQPGVEEESSFNLPPDRTTGANATSTDRQSAMPSPHPPPLHDSADQSEECVSTPPSSPVHTSPPTPHSVPASSPNFDRFGRGFPPPPPILSDTPKLQREPSGQLARQTPGPYASPFLAVIVDPRAAGPHTLVALRSLHRLLDRGSIVQLTRAGNRQDATGERSSGGLGEFVHETSLEPIARGVLACRFEQTDAGVDEAVETAIADLLQLIVELDSAGARSAESALLRQIYMSKKGRQSQPLTKDEKNDAVSNSAGAAGTPSSNIPSKQKPGTMIRIQRLSSSVILESFHAVFETRHTFVAELGGGHHSPALSFHFEQVLARMIFCLFGGEDSQSTLKKGNVITSRHVVGSRKILEYLIGQLNRPPSVVGGLIGDNGRMLCLRLIQCCLSTGWGRDSCAYGQPIQELATSEKALSVDDKALLKLVEDDLCLALLTTGQSIWTDHDEVPSTSTDVGGSSRSVVSIDLLSEVCSTFTLLWNLPRLRSRLQSQFESLFSGFYQRALSLLRRRPLPVDGLAYQANFMFDMEAEVILESLVDILCLEQNGTSGDPSSTTKFSTLESLFITYDCNERKSDVASGLVMELALCCGGQLGEDGEPVLPPSPSNSRTRSPSEGDAASLIARHRPVPEHLKELCFEALVGSLRRLSYGSEPLPSVREIADGVASLREAKNRKQLLYHAAKLFNDKPKKGLQYLLDNEMLTSPPTAQSVAAFLRTGLVVGLDKPAVGQYLGEIGKKTSPDSSPVIWDQDTFHKELLTSFCSSFVFENQTVLDSLRMFLATFRLPGEAQMIDRILQAFAESVAASCNESTSGSLKLFSEDPKKASDAAYLLSFSIIMLNTDLHNENIRQDRKMKLSDFIRNNKNYGKEISDDDLPPEYLEGIYSAIKENQIRTLGEGADGSMTSERWKDVMRGSSSFKSGVGLGSANEAKELLLESCWRPVLSAVSGLWLMPEEFEQDLVSATTASGRQGARLGVDLAHSLLSVSSHLNRNDVFRDVFLCVCSMSGLGDSFDMPGDERAYQFISSVERQGAFTIAVCVAEENGDLLGMDGWKAIWSMIFELRDLYLLSGVPRPNILKESDPDLLTGDARDEFSRRIVFGDEVIDTTRTPRGLMSFMFGANSNGSLDSNSSAQDRTDGLGEQLIWDDLAPSDDEEEEYGTGEATDYLPFSPRRRNATVGTSLAHQLAMESLRDNDEMGVTGLERIESGPTGPISHRAQVRHRLSALVDFYGLITESRYLSDDGLSDELNSLVEIIHDSAKQKEGVSSLSPASEAFAEVLICELAIRNRDRFSTLWDNILGAHYNSRLTFRPSRREGEDEAGTIALTSGVEKCVTGLLRLCVWSTGRSSISDRVLPLLNILHPPLGALVWSPLELNLDKHMAEGLWRICRDVDSQSQIDGKGWGAILGLIEWCATRGGMGQHGMLDEDDPSLQSFRSLHLILHAAEIKDLVPYECVRSIRCLVEAGERANNPKLSIAGLDLLQALHTRMESLVINNVDSDKLLQCWLPTLDAIGEPAEKSKNPSVRQQAISLLTDTILDRHGSSIPIANLYEVLNDICIPIAGDRIADLLRRIPSPSDMDDTLIELELCISLLFKPFLHHLKALISIKQEFIAVWISMLGIMTQFLSEGGTEADVAIDDDENVSSAKLFQTTKELGSEHLRNAVMVLAAMGVLGGGDEAEADSGDISDVTWKAIGSISKSLVDEWKTCIS